MKTTGKRYKNVSTGMAVTIVSCFVDTENRVVIEYDKDEATSIEKSFRGDWLEKGTIRNCKPEKVFDNSYIKIV